MTDIATLSIAVDSSPVNKAKTSMEGMGNTAKWLEGIVGKLVAAWASWEVAGKIKDMALLSARYETLGVVMGVVGNNAGYSGQQMREFEKALEKSGISMVESRNTLTVMSQAHIDLAKSQQLAREAQDAAVIGNMNSSEAFQNMIHGIQSGQTEILRTIGINVNFEASYQKLALQLHKNANDLTEYEKVQARTNAVLSKAPDLAGAYEAAMGTAGKQVLSMKRYVEDLEVKAGAVFGPALSTVVDALTESLKGSAEWFDKNQIAAESAAQSFKKAAEQTKGLVGDIIGLGSGTKDLLGDVTLLEMAGEGLAVAVGGIRDLVNEIIGLTQVSAGLMSIIGRGVDEFAIKITGIHPPAWIEKIISMGGTSAVSAGWERMKKPFTSDGGVQQAIDPGGNIQEEIAKEMEKQAKANQLEQKKIQGAHDAEARLKAEQERLKKLKELDEQTKRIKQERKSFLEKVNEELGTFGDNGKNAKEEYEAKRLGLTNNKAWKELQELRAYRKADIAASMQAADEADLTKNTNGLAFQNRQDQLQREIELYQNGVSVVYPYQQALEQLGQQYEGLVYLRDTNQISQAQFIRGEEKLVSETRKTLPVMTDMFGDLRDTINDWSRSSTDAFVEFCFTAKNTFGDLVTSMLKDLARLAVQKNVMDPIFSYAAMGISAWLGSGSGTDLGSGSILSGDGNSVNVTGSTWYDGNTISDLPSLGYVAPAASVATAGSSPVQINAININAATGKATTDMSGQSAAQLSKAITGAVQAEIVKQKRTGGLLA